MFKNLVIGVDFSKESVGAFRQAEKIAKRYKSKILLVHVALDPGEFNKSDQYAQNLKRAVIDKIQKKYLPKDRSAEVNIKVCFGSPAREITKVARELPRSLIVVGSSSKKTNLRFFPGSMALGLATHAEVPVWLHKKTIGLHPKILIPFDMTSYSDSLLSEGELIAKSLGGSPRGLYILEPLSALLNYDSWFEYQEIRTTQKKAEFDDLAKKFKKIKMSFAKGIPEEEIKRASSKVDLIVIQSHQREWLENMVSTTNRVAQESAHSVLILPFARKDSRSVTLF